MIFTGFQPNASSKDIRTALTYLLFPWKWHTLIEGEYEQKAHRMLRKFFSADHLYLFDSGRSALESALRALDIRTDDEVIVQAYTCVVVTNAIKWTGAKPVYVDVTHTFTINPAELEKKITPKTKAIIVQHTFGIPADMDAIMALARHYHIPVIEDCAHVIGGEYRGKKLGTIGDMGMLSFGTDKVLSCGRGGALLVNNDDIAEQLEAQYAHIPYPKRRWIIPYLWNFPLFPLGKSLYRIGIGKYFLAALKKLSITGRVIYDREKKGERSHFAVSRLANSLAHILCIQLHELEELNEHRHQIARWYEEEIDRKHITFPPKLTATAYVRYPIVVDTPKELHNFCKKNGILLGEWYDTVIAPNDIVFSNTGYVAGSCPVAENLSSRSINLPTSRHISTEDADTISRMITAFYAQN